MVLQERTEPNETEVDEEFTLDTPPPTSVIKDIDRIGTNVEAGDDNIDQIAEQDDEALENKLSEYENAGPNLIEHHHFMEMRFDLLFAQYVSIFTTLDVLSAVAETISAVLPNFELQETFSFFDLNGEARDIADELSAIIVGATVIGGAASVGTVVRSYGEWKKARSTSSNAQAHVKLKFKGKVIPKGTAKALTGLRKTNWLKGLGFVGAIAGAAGGVAGIYAAIKDAKQVRNFLERSVFGFQKWYDETRISYEALAGGVDTIENDLRQLMLVLGIVGIDDGNPITEANVQALKTQLENISTKTSKQAIMVETAARIFCRNNAASPGSVASLTSLNPLRVADIQDQITGPDGATICKLVDPA